jgi:hypothetical protein
MHILELSKHMSTVTINKGVHSINPTCLCISEGNIIMLSFG